MSARLRRTGIGRQLDLRGAGRPALDARPGQGHDAAASAMNRELDDQAFLAEVQELVSSRLLAGEPAGADEFLAARPHLRAEVLESVRKAERLRAQQAPPQVDGYVLERELGRGAMGTVWLARQLSLGGRLIALKVLAAPFARSPDVWARFLLEVQALARLRHPNVVAVHDVVEQGDVLAYAMDWIEGRTLAQIIAHLNQLPGRGDAAALQGFLGGSAMPEPVPFLVQVGVQIARALDEAHRLRLMHRDVKPSNILVRTDGTAVLSDFGLVRADDSSMHTQTGDFLGTPAYAAPEQLEGRIDAVDARSDVYGLGATLYHALTGKLPFPGRSAHEVLRRIREGFCQPVRSVDPRVPRELETIVHKAMDPDRDRRYASASALADDLERFQNGRPILARPASAFYQFRKLVQRHRAAFALLAVLFAALAGFAVVMAVVSGRLADQKEQLRQQNVEIEEKSQLAQAEAERARVQARRAERTSTFIQDIFSAVNPTEGGRDVLVSAKLDAAAQRLHELDDEPEVQAAVRYRLGRAYRSLGKYRQAEAHLAAALAFYRPRPEDQKLVRDALFDLAACLQERGDLDAARPLLDEARSIQRQLPRAEAEPDTEILDRVSVSRKRGRWHLGKEEYREARVLFQQALADLEELERIHGEDHPQTAEVLVELSMASEDPAETQSLLRRALAKQHADELTTAEILGSLAGLLADTEDPAEAESFGKRALEIFQRRLGPRHDRVGTTMSVLAMALQKLGKSAEAEQFGSQAASILREALGANHPELARVVYYLGSARLERGDAAGAAAALDEAVDMMRAMMPDHPDLAIALDKLGTARRELGELDKSRALFLEALQLFQQLPEFGREHYRTANTLLSLGRVAQQAREFDAAIKYLTQSLEIQRHAKPERPLTRMGTERLLANSFVAVRRFDEAEKLLLDVYSRSGAEPAATPEHDKTAKALVALYEAWGRPEKAEQYRDLR
jgi:tetratricopeptide (TPR) repeat protein